jgi:hypothetical protein
VSNMKVISKMIVAIASVAILPSPNVCLALSLLSGLCQGLLVFPVPASAESFGVPVSAPTPVPILPTDVTNLPLIDGLPLGPVNMPRLQPTSAIKRLSESSFSTVINLEQVKDVVGGIIVEPKKGADFETTSPACFQLNSGTIFVSVRKPAKVAIISTPHGSIAVVGDGDAIITFEDGLLKVMNLSALGERVKVQIHQAALSARILSSKGINNGGMASGDSGSGISGSGNIGVGNAGADGIGAGGSERAGGTGRTGVNGVKSYRDSSTQGIVMAVKIGHELIATDRPLTRLDLSPSDGIARRRSALFENDRMAVSEFSLESALAQGEFLATLGQNNPSHQKRKVLAELAKMAAVLNYVDGKGGFVAPGKLH